jgi:hypothetical protein
MPTGGSPQQQGWVWDGSNWVCDPDCGDGAQWPPFGPPVFSGPVNQPPWYPGANGGVSFGAVAPPNPVRGHLWWDGSGFWLFDGAAWVLIGGTPGTGTAPGTGATQLVFSLTSGASINTGAAATFNIVPFTSTPTVDTLTGWNSVTHQYTPKKPGTYLVFTRAFKPAAQSGCTIAVIRNDNGTFTFNSQWWVCVNGITAAIDDWIMANGMVAMNGTTDFIRMWAATGDGILNQLSSVMPTLEVWRLP